ncbi:hypothetical protein FHG64_05700 [Antarcticibacterium flavum]|uniref:Uncharacterized protein n=1 Tax=Antarcticibacterium flavum TaxID=2058175 RepID=A0A5B7X0S0_9FLAO|nr:MULTISPECIES: hypothetical protein [Antarcticibacterium]MCM4161621.1 hypothetical protein [Antarcticibacterium sp. W02-3]QCY68937.1 hypothetical protein FHG64_05700 [Antarcticibacterium flavum]
MTTYYKRKALQATENKIASNIRQSNYFGRNLWQVIGFGILVSLYAPTHSSGNKGKMLYEDSELSYFELVVSTAVVYTVFCMLGHFIWGYQDRRKHERLMERKRQLEAELKIK